MCREFSSRLRKPVGVETWIAPPQVYLAELVSDQKLCQFVRFGLQNIHEAEKGAYTGEVSAAMAKDTGATFTIIGHSERRTLLGETDEIIAKKLQRCFSTGLTPILCVGESLSERENGKAYDVVENQINQALKECDLSKETVTIAYEPVWAIGTGISATPEDAEAMHSHIQSIMRKRTTHQGRILYGGSVKPETAGDLIRQPSIHGFLVGNASLKPESLNAICTTVSEN